MCKSFKSPTTSSLAMFNTKLPVLRLCLTNFTEGSKHINSLVVITVFELIITFEPIVTIPVLPRHYLVLDKDYNQVVSVVKNEKYASLLGSNST